MPKKRGPKNISRERIIEALQKHRGWITYAAAELECTQANISIRLKTDKILREAYEKIKERNLDFVEKALFIKIANGDTGAIIFYLKCQGKHRGYVEKEKESILIQNTINTAKKKIKGGMSAEEASKLYIETLNNR